MKKQKPLNRVILDLSDTDLWMLQIIIRLYQFGIPITDDSVRDTLPNAWERRGMYKLILNRLVHCGVITKTGKDKKYYKPMIGVNGNPPKRILAAVNDKGVKVFLCPPAYADGYDSDFLDGV